MRGNVLRDYVRREYVHGGMSYTHRGMSVSHVDVTYRKVTGYSSAIPHMPAHNAALQLKDYQPMDMTGQRTRIPVVAANPAVSIDFAF